MTIRSVRAVANTRTPAATRPLGAAIGALGGFWSRGRRVERACYVLGGVLLLSGLFHLGVFAVLGGPWQGPVSWRKPTTFGLSFGLTLITITWVSTFLPLRERARTGWLGVFAAACTLEVVLIGLQTWRRRPSHFDLETPFDAVVARLLAVGGGVLIVVIVALAIAALRRDTRQTASMRLALQAGFLSLLAALAVGGAMIARGMVQVAGGHQQEAYVVGGSLKPAHAVTMHGILVLPALAWVLSFVPWSEARRLRLTRWAVGGYALLAMVVVVAAIAGVDLARPPRLVLVLAGVGALALVVAGVVALVAGVRPRVP